MATPEKLLETTTEVDAKVVETSSSHEEVEKGTAVVTVSVASVEAAPVASKRAAKKGKKSPKKEDAAGDADVDADSSGNIAATIDHPYLSFLHKRIRLYKKKLEKIKALAAAQANDGKVLNDQQLELVGSKSLVEKMITEFESLREQFIEVFVKEEAEKRAAEKLTAVLAPQPESVVVKEPVVVKEEEKKEEKEEDAVVPRDAFAYVEDLLRTLHAVTLHQALGEDVPMVLDYFSKVLLGTTRPPAEVPFEENLAESLEEATRYLTKSDKPVVMDVTYQDLRAMVEKLGAAPEEVVEVEEVVEEMSLAVEAPAAEELPHINFFTDSQLEYAAAEAMAEDKASEPQAAPVAIETPVSEQEQPKVEEEAKAAPVTKKPRNRKSNTAVAGSGDEKPPQRRRSQNRNKNHSSDKSPRGTGEGKTLEGAKADTNGTSKPRRSRAPRSNDENGGSHNANRSSSGGVKPDRPRSDRPVRKPQQPQHKEPVQA